MEISTKYNPADTEQKWYQYWLEQKFFESKPDQREPYTIVIPPPNVTGVLHMGHLLNNTIQDVLIRTARMKGKNACWVPGTDHASIATEAKVVQMLKEKGIEKKDITREEFLKYAFEWKEKYGGIILHQLQKLGASCDWSRTRFTMEDDMSQAVIDSFVDLYEKGYIYRGIRMVNWDPAGKTALSDEEVIFKENNGKFYHIKYKIVGTDDYLTIATVRPETIFGDTAVCANPNDKRYQHLKGKKVIVPIINREVPIIFDEYVDADFGTGLLKITPAHDINDYEIGLKHHLEVIDTIADDGTLSAACGVPKYVGVERFIARKMIAKELKELDLLVKEEDYKNQVGTSERTGAVIEPKLSTQWFMKMQDIAKPALENVMNDNIQFHPAKFKNMYRSWMENLKDWCVSRQLWWGQRIPAYYLSNGEIIVAKSKEEALQKANDKIGHIDGWILAAERGNISHDDIPKLYTEQDLKQDEDVLDTWASSWLWPISVFDGFKEGDKKDFNYYYPTSTLVTGFDIIFFWVARMIMAGYEFTGKMPFKDVYFTGLIRDKLGRKMSKSLGNSPEALRLIDMYSADGVRFGLLRSSAAGNDLLFDTDVPKSQKKEDVEAFSNDPISHNSKLCEQGRNFTNKIWNAFRLLKGWKIDENLPFKHKIAVEWIETKLNITLASIEENTAKYRLSEALNDLYNIFWDDYCSWYLEMIKPIQSDTIDSETYKRTLVVFEKLLKILHPFMPFITEELWQNIKERKNGESICVAQYPTTENTNTENKNLIEKAQLAFDTIINIRNFRNKKGISPKETLDLQIKIATINADFEPFIQYIERLANLSTVAFSEQKPAKVFSFVIKNYEFFIPFEENEKDANVSKNELLKELEYAKGFKESILKKLNNEKFVQNAKPEVIENEKKKLADAEAKIKALEESL
ncbi:MAG: valine--tRNA ligase [Cytophagales bacterium]|nr:MAG: valine--tRNA ligase [Cytophagales bacterium]